MKKILIVNGSKRRKGNSYALEGRIAEQLQGKAEVTAFRTFAYVLPATAASGSTPPTVSRRMTSPPSFPRSIPVTPC